MKYLLLYLFLIPVFFAIDILWISRIAKNLYFKELAHLIADPIKTAPAAGFYLIYIIGIIIFGILPAFKSGNWHTAAMWGALFGFFTYATYDFTNWATLRNWPVNVVIIDIIWGTALCATVATAGFFIGQSFLGL